jgi:hypothetical protein
MKLAHAGRLTVEAAREVRGDGLEILGSRLNEIDDRYLPKVSRLQLEAGKAHTSGIMWRVVPIFKCIVT